tara:strand:+ start:311 stop:610 length:300 start_codon:yes stop_codon:yes gene_type:complete
MNNLQEIRLLLQKVFNKKKYKEKKMIQVFQWSRYIQWKDLTPEEKLSAKRILLLPLFVYVILNFLNKNLLLIILLLIGYILYKKSERGITKNNNKIDRK